MKYMDEKNYYVDLIIDLGGKAVIKMRYVKGKIQFFQICCLYIYIYIYIFQGYFNILYTFDYIIYYITYIPTFQIYRQVTKFCLSSFS